ncbi:nitroreductase family protein [Paenibacillus lautus]|jgi:nitroreductase|uniref:Nitroreductase family protein n=1 Tax=Paenibacillus lautus TaxID=1401 RepID=A0A385TEG4_PAELA|nr:MULTISPECIES: nitroreductase family protein [Paenibacillus]MBY0165037.1 nitroreductase family protein [Cytobacillus firmus]VTR20164.1 putative NAD(P)H nitroreductase [Actinobacillus pleuropneumoniae]AYB42049.1 nitroreductase family protein [Paenibacillus lautus]QOT09998.1 nitroreductase family protein [Paenibacillus sp. JNUCC-32]WFB57992.1 nitroreductase family protein [Paenibacillus sp. BR1-192]
MFNHIQNNDFANIVMGRRSVRNYDENFKISKEEMSDMISEASLAPSSANMQPWRVIVVDTPEGKEKLRPLVRFNTLQNDTSSAMLLIFGDTQSYLYAEEIYNTAVEQGKMPAEVRDRQLETILSLFPTLSREMKVEIAKIDSSLFAMQFMLVARAHGYDTNPMAGFEADQLAKAFDVDEERYAPVMVISLGKAKEDGHESVRLEPDKITFWR